MILETLILTNFKNYETERFDCSPVLNCFTGMNGMGKTNLLDAIYYLCMGKSHFNLPDLHLVRHEAGFFRLEGHFRREGRKETIVVKVQPRRRKELERNAVPYSRLSDHVGLIPVVFIAPDDTLLITEGSEARRRFLDNTLSQLDQYYLQQLILYNKVLKRRNALLKQFGDTNRYQPELIEAYDAQLSGPATYIHQRRGELLELFRPFLRQTVHALSGAREEADCLYLSPLHDRPLDELLREAAEKDRILERTTTGIHRDDLDFTLNGYPLKKYASQGQLKSFLLGLKLAQYELLRHEKSTPPLLLLDDLFDKLDASRVEFLLELLLQQQFGQLFITDTHEKRTQAIIRQLNADYRTFKVDHGKVSHLA